MRLGPWHSEIHKLRMLCRVCKMFIGRAFEQCVSKKCPKAEEGERKCGSRNWVEQMALSSNNTWLIEVGRRKQCLPRHPPHWK